MAFAGRLPALDDAGRTGQIDCIALLAAKAPMQNTHIVRPIRPDDPLGYGSPN